MTDLSIQYIPLNEIQEAILNPRTHDLDSLRASVDTHGFADSLIRDDRTGRLVAGHGRLEELRARQGSDEHPPTGIRVDDSGEWLVPVQVGWASKDDAHATSFLLASNKLVENASWRKDEVAALIAALEDQDPALVLAAGFDQEAISEAIAAADDERMLDVEGDADFETVTLRLPPDVALSFRAALDAMGGTESESVRRLVQAATESRPPF